MPAIELWNNGCLFKYIAPVKSPEKYTITRASEEDLAIIESIAQRTWPDTFGEILSPAQIDYMLEMMYAPVALKAQMDKGHVFWLLQVAEGAVGYVSYELDYLPATTKIHKIYLLPSTQGRGLGRALLEHVEVIAKEAGQAKLRLDVNYQNKAIGFYEKYGLVKIGRHDTDIGNGYLMEDWIMEKEV